MNIIETMSFLQEFRAKLAAWGITNETLIFIGVVALILWLLSAREVLGWFFKTHMIRDEIRDLRREVVELQKIIHEIHEIKEKPSDLQKPEKISAASSREVSSAAPATEEEGRPAVSKFRLDH